MCLARQRSPVVKSCLIGILEPDAFLPIIIRLYAFVFACPCGDTGVRLLPDTHERRAEQVRWTSTPIANRYLPAMYRPEGQLSLPHVSGL